MEIIRATETWQMAGAWYVRVQAMAKKHHITLDREFDALDGPDMRYILALDGDFPVGTARLYPIEGGQSMMIGRVVVLPEYRHKGLGSAIMAACEDWIKDLGCRTAVLESRDNKTEFYARLGYTITGDAFIDGDTFRCIRMEKTL